MLLCMSYSHTRSDKSGDSTSRYYPERRGNLHATGWLLIGRGSWRQHGTRVAPLAKFENLSPPETICSHHQMRNPSILVNSNILGAETEIPRVDSASHVVETPIPLVGHCVVEPARGKSCLSGQRRGPAAPGEDAVSFPDKKIIHVFAPSTTWEQRRRLPAPLPPRRVWKPPSRLLVAVYYRDPAQRGLPLWPASKSCRTRGG